MSKVNLRLSKKAIEELPSNKPGVYVIKNHRGTSLFAGIAKRGQVQEQLLSHFYGGENYVPGAWISYEQFNNLTEAGDRLKVILERDNPKYN
jgi:excinuclease UvrABC nuclease subunit